jgi:hypothetical protein
VAIEEDAWPALFRSKLMAGKFCAAGLKMDDRRRDAENPLPRVGARSRH